MVLSVLPPSRRLKSLDRLSSVPSALRPSLRLPFFNVIRVECARGSCNLQSVTPVLSIHKTNFAFLTFLPREGAKGRLDFGKREIQENSMDMSTMFVPEKRYNIHSLNRAFSLYNYVKSDAASHSRPLLLHSGDNKRSFNPEMTGA